MVNKLFISLNLTLSVGPEAAPVLKIIRLSPAADPPELCTDSKAKVFLLDSGECMAIMPPEASSLVNPKY